MVTVQTRRRALLEAGAEKWAEPSSQTHLLQFYFDEDKLALSFRGCVRLLPPIFCGLLVTSLASLPVF